MKILKTKIKDLIIIKEKKHVDSRGWFSEAFKSNFFSENKLNYEFIQDNHVLSHEIGTLRGLHFQIEPYAQTKLIRVLKGKILDVAVDLRPKSKTFKQHLAIVISDKNDTQLLVPKGFAHGYITLEKNTEVMYKVDNVYHKPSERTIRYNDPDLKIDWIIKKPILSIKDSKALFLKNYNGF